jgi:hypothetical protein
MRLISAALLGAAASLPTLVHAGTTISDPADAAAPVPAITVPSAFDGYRRYSDADHASWQQLNRAVEEKPRASGMMHGHARTKPADGGPSKHSQHEARHEARHKEAAK